MYRLSAFTAILITILTFATVGWAENSVKKIAKNKSDGKLEYVSDIVLDGKRYSADYIVDDFLQVAFSNEIWGKHVKHWHPAFDRNYLMDVDNLDAVKTKVRKDRFFEYKTYLDGMPQHNSLYKWTGEITIGIGNFRIPEFELEEEHIIRDRIKEENESEYFKYLQSMAEQMRNVTGLSVRVLTPSEERLSGERAKLRIITTKYFDQDNLFKYFPRDPTEKYKSPDFGERLRKIELGFMAAVPFTAKARAQVEGVLLPNKDNSIGYAFCMLSPDVGEKLIYSLISECLWRSLGLPELVSSTSRDCDLKDGKADTSCFNPEHSLLGEWNIAHASHSKRDIYEGMKAFSNKKREFPYNLTDKTRLYKEPTEYDILMASLLYCSEMKPGMDKYEFLLALKNNRCFYNLLRSNRREGEK